MMIGIPMLQLILFGYAINSDPKHLPTAVYSADNSVFSRTIVWGLRNSSYFDIVREPKNEAEIQRLLAQGTVQFAVHIPVDFSRKLLRGERPDLLLEADATDPSAIGYAIAAINLLTTTMLDRDLTGPLAKLRGTPPPINLVVHQHYNPENITQYNIVPGLMGVMLTMTMIIITALAITRERERGTMENLLSTPARPGEVMIGKIVPYITVGYIQVFLILLASKFLFNVPIVGSVSLLLVLTFLVHRGESRGRHHVFDHCQKPASSGANGVFLFPAVFVVIRLHVSVSRHAGLGAGHRRNSAADAFSAGRARDSAERKRFRRNRARPLADCAVSGRDAGHRHQTLSPDAGLNGYFSGIIRCHPSGCWLNLQIEAHFGSPYLNVAT